MESNKIIMNEISDMEPIEVAEWLMHLVISETGEVTNSTTFDGDHIPVFDACELAEIAEHLLIYTKYTGKRER